MTEEFIDILSEKGEFTGRIATKKDIHLKGYYHNTAHVWLYTKKGEILLQQRSKTKAIYPLLWDVSVAGHIDAGETVIDGALREMKEEIGYKLSKNDLIKLNVYECFRTYGDAIIDNEFRHTFIAELKVELNRLKPQKEEVEALKLVTIKDFLDLLNNSNTNNHFVKSNESYYLSILKTIKEKLN